MFKSLIKRNVAFFAVITVLLFIESYLLGVFSTAATTLHIQDKVLDWDHGNVVLTLQHETDPTTLPDTDEILARFRNLYQALATDNRYDYYELYAQPLYLVDSQENAADTMLQAEQISENVISAFGLEVSEGRLLEQNDFIWNSGNSIPVLLGNSFKSQYALGNTFQAEYLFQVFSFQVVGFLETDCAINRSNGMILLDDCVVMPSFDPNSSPETSSEFVFQKIHWANRTSGKLYISPDAYDSVANDVLSLLSNSGIGEYSYYTNVLVEPFWLGLSLQLTAVLTVILAIAMFCITLFLFRVSHCHFVFIFSCIAIGCFAGLSLSWVTIAEDLQLFVLLRWTVPVFIIQALLSTLLTSRIVQVRKRAN